MALRRGREVPDTTPPQIQELHIRNFRGFTELHIDRIETINLITGMNNVGKSALLDALFVQLGPNNPELLIRTNVFRGMDRVELDAEEVWGGFFHNRNFKDPMTIKTDYSDFTSSILRINLAVSNRIQGYRRNTNERPTSAGYITTTQIKRDELRYEYRSGSSNHVSRAYIEDGDIKFDRAPIRNLRQGVYVGAKRRFLEEDATRFSKLERQGKDADIIETLSILEPRLKRISVLYTGGSPLLHGDLQQGSLIPIPAMGDGMSRLLEIILAIITFEGGIVLIDEIENGLHYSFQEAIWDAIARTARKYQVQIFATTHSFECIRSAHRAFSKSEKYDLRLHRLERNKDNHEQINVLTYDQETVGTSLDMNFEIR